MLCVQSWCVLKRNLLAAETVLLFTKDTLHIVTSAKKGRATPDVSPLCDICEACLPCMYGLVFVCGKRRRRGPVAPP